MSNIPAPTSSSWGSPTTTKRALLIHGLSSSSHTWHRVATSLAAQGYLVTAPNLIGHGSRMSTDYHFSAIAEDLRPYLERDNYSLIIGHSLGALTALSLFPHLSASYPTAIMLVDPSMQLSSEKLDWLDDLFTDMLVNIKPAETHAAENPLWTWEDAIYRELGTRLCSVEAVHGIVRDNRVWNFFSYLDAVPKKWRVTALLADPAMKKTRNVEDFDPYPHVPAIIVPGAAHWIQSEYPEVIVEEALKMVVELDHA